MFDVGAPELLLIAIVALVVVGPKDLPRLLRTAGQWMGKARSTARHFRTGIDTMIREAELEEMQKKWEAQNADIMKAHPVVDQAADQTGADGQSPASPPPSAA